MFLAIGEFLVYAAKGFSRAIEPTKHQFQVTRGSDHPGEQIHPLLHHRFEPSAPGINGAALPRPAAGDWYACNSSVTKC